MNDTDKFRIVEDRPSLIVCHNCGDECQDRGAWYARNIYGWKGFSRETRVKQPDGFYRQERLGECPSCQA